MIGSLTASPTLAPLLSQVCRTQIQRYQRAAAAGGGPSWLLSPPPRSGGWTRLWLGFAARLFLGIAAAGGCRERAGCGAGPGREPCGGARRCRQLRTRSPALAPPARPQRRPRRGSPPAATSVPPRASSPLGSFRGSRLAAAMHHAECCARAPPRSLAQVPPPARPLPPPPVTKERNQQR